MNMTCTLMNKNREVAQIEGAITYNAKNINMPQVQAEKVTMIEPELAPVCMAYPAARTLEAAFNIWYLKRLVSDRRPDIPKRDRIIARWLQLERSDLPRSFSLTDQYWLRFDKAETWDRYNFFTNPYSTACGDYFFSANRDVISEARYVFNSPDITLNGVQPKRWLRETDSKGDAVNMLYKAGYKEKDLAVIAEVMAARELRKLKKIPFVDYEFGVTGYQLCSKSRCFITESQEFVPASHVYSAFSSTDKGDRYTRLMANADRLGIPVDKTVEFIDMMIEIDRIFLNFDRHLGNFGFIRNVDTGKFEGPAPLFDFGGCFFLTEETEKKLVSHQLEYLFENRAKALIRKGKINPREFTVPPEICQIPVTGATEVRLKRAENDMNFMNEQIAFLAEARSKHAHCREKEL